MSLEDLLAKLPENMADDLRECDPIWAAETAQIYLDADEATQADIRAFHDSGGPATIKRIVDRGIE